MSPAPAPMPLLQVENVTKRYGGVVIVQDVGFDVAEGEILGLAGPNGAGKTTILNAIAGLISVSGRIRFAGEDVTGLRSDQMCRRGIARTFQTPAPFEHLSIRKHIALAARFGIPAGEQAVRERVEMLLDVIEPLRSIADQYPDGLSRFQLQLAMIAAALATRPRLLLLDEPAGGLSPAEIESLIDLIRRTRKQFDLSIILIEHLMKVIMDVCDRLLILHQGTVLRVGTPREVADDPDVIRVYLGSEAA